MMKFIRPGIPGTNTGKNTGFVKPDYKTAPVAKPLPRFFNTLPVRVDAPSVAGRASSETKNLPAPTFVNAIRAHTMAGTTRTQGGALFAASRGVVFADGKDKDRAVHSSRLWSKMFGGAVADVRDGFKWRVYR